MLGDEASNRAAVNVHNDSLALNCVRNMIKGFELDHVNYTCTIKNCVNVVAAYIAVQTQLTQTTKCEGGTVPNHTHY